MHNINDWTMRRKSMNKSSGSMRRKSGGHVTRMNINRNNKMVT